MSGRVADDLDRMAKAFFKLQDLARSLKLSLVIKLFQHIIIFHVQDLGSPQAVMDVANFKLHKAL